MARDDESAPQDTVRLEALSDGVIAIVMTLLVIEIAVPHVEGEQSLWRALADQWPSYFGFVLSFITIGIMWLNHHLMFKDIARTDHVILTLNLLLLLTFSFVPFSTAVLAEYLEDSEHRLTATVVYGGTFVLTAICFNALWLYAAGKRDLLTPGISEARIRDRSLRYLPGPFLYASGLLLALISPWISMVLYSVMAGAYLLPLRD